MRKAADFKKIMIIIFIILSCRSVFCLFYLSWKNVFAGFCPSLHNGCCRKRDLKMLGKCFTDLIPASHHFWTRQKLFDKCDFSFQCDAVFFPLNSTIILFIYFVDVSRKYDESSVSKKVQAIYQICRAIFDIYAGD